MYYAYCDGGSHSANVSEPVAVWDNSTNSTIELYFRGRFGLLAMRDELIRLDYMNATELVVTGCSAGGLTAYLQGDFVLDLLVPLAPALTQWGNVPEFGDFMDYRTPVTNFSLGMHWIYDNMKPVLNADCLAHYAPTNTEWTCIFAQTVMPFMHHRYFAVQSRFDSWQSQCVVGSNSTELMSAFGYNLTVGFFNGAILESPQNGGLLDSCFHHCSMFVYVLFVCYYVVVVCFLLLFFYS